MVDSRPSQLKEHWDSVYSSNEVETLGWYEDVPTQSLKLISLCNLQFDDEIIDIGCGASLLIDNLVNLGYQKIIAVDLSETALAHLKNRLGKQKAAQVRWIIENLTSPRELTNLRNMSLWHDRAVLHFLVHECDRQTYRKILFSSVKVNGYAIIAAFSLKGAKKCSGLDVYRYDENILADFLGDEFTLLKHFDYLYQMPSGEYRPYIYTLFQRQ
jgi:SAM-dependent methyltransferase